MKLVMLKNKEALTTSLVVAEYFKKEHFHILRDIEEIKCNFGQSKIGESQIQ